MINDRVIMIVESCALMVHCGFLAWAILTHADFGIVYNTLVVMYYVMSMCYYTNPKRNKIDD